MKTLDISCRKCGVAVGERCVNLSQCQLGPDYIKRPHRDRVTEARELTVALAVRPNTTL